MNKTNLITAYFFSLCLLMLPGSGQAEDVQPVVRGLLKPIHEATLSSEILAKVTEMPFRAGKRFKKGDVLVRFDCTRYKAEFSAAQAEYAAHKKTSDNNVELSTYNAVASLQVDVSKLETEKAQAQLAVTNAVLSACVLYAPWNGRVVETFANQHETVSPGKALLHILNDSVLEIEVLAPSKWLNAIKVGTAFSFSVDETGKTYPAKLTAIGSVVDPVSQTVRLIGALDNPHGGLLPGMSGSPKFDAIKPVAVAPKP